MMTAAQEKVTVRVRTDRDLKTFHWVTTLIAMRCLSGLQVRYDMKKPSGNRVVDIQVRCAACQIPVYKPLDKSAVYRVILSSYIARGGAGLSVIADKKLSHQVGNITDDIVVMNYFKANSPIMTGVENRITFVHRENKLPMACAGTKRIQALNMMLGFAVVVKYVMWTCPIFCAIQLYDQQRQKERWGYGTQDYNLPWGETRNSQGVAWNKAEQMRLILNSSRNISSLVYVYNL